VIKLQAAAILHAVKLRLLPQFDDAIELTYLHAGITNADIAEITHPDQEVRKRNVEALKNRDQRKWELLCNKHFEFHPERFNVLRQFLAKPETKLGIKAEVLRLNGYKVTRQNLAAVLCISVSMLYDRFGREAVRKACSGRPAYPVAPDRLRFEL
jgi:hypothetical protein